MHRRNVLSRRPELLGSSLSERLLSRATSCRSWLRSSYSQSSPRWHWERTACRGRGPALPGTACRRHCLDGLAQAPARRRLGTTPPSKLLEAADESIFRACAYVKCRKMFDEQLDRVAVGLR